MVKIHIEVFSDTLCPWCYIGKKHLDRAIDLSRQQNPNAVFEVEWKPFYLYPNIPRIEGQPKSRLLEPVPPETQKRIVHAGSRVGITFRLDARVTGHSAASHTLLRLALRYSVPASSPPPSSTTCARRSSASSQGSSIFQGFSTSSPSTPQTFTIPPTYPSPQSRLLDALFAAHFEQGLNIASPALLLSLAESVGISRSDTQSILSSDTALRETDTKATHSRNQVRGVPTITIQGRWRVGGMQEADMLLGVFEQAAREAPRRLSATTRERRCESVETAEGNGGAVRWPRKGICLKEILLDENAP